jgi:hypothetical protein
MAWCIDAYYGGPGSDRRPGSDGEDEG